MTPRTKTIKVAHKHALNFCIENDCLIHVLFNRNGYIEHKDQPPEPIDRFDQYHTEKFIEMGILENVRGNYYKVNPHPDIAIKNRRTINRQKDISGSQAYADIIAKLEKAGYNHGGVLQSTDDLIMILPPKVNDGKLFIDTIERPSGAYNYKSGYEGQRRSIHTMGSKIRAVERIIEWLIYNRIPLRLPKIVKHG